MSMCAVVMLRCRTVTTEVAVPGASCLAASASTAAAAVGIVLQLLKARGAGHACCKMRMV